MKRDINNSENESESENEIDRSEINQCENNCINIREIYLSSSDKWLVSMILGGFFAVLSLPFAYYFTSLFVHALGGDHLIYYRAINMPTIVGVLIHSILFVLIVRGWMEIQF